MSFVLIYISTQNLKTHFVYIISVFRVNIGYHLLNNIHSI